MRESQTFRRPGWTTVLRTKPPLTANRATAAFGPNRTFMTFAANGSLEPKVTDAAACTNGSNSTKADVKLVQTAKMQLRLLSVTSYCVLNSDNRLANVV